MGDVVIERPLFMASLDEQLICARTLRGLLSLGIQIHLR